MVKNSGETLRAGAAYKSLNTPDRLRVEVNAEGQPAVIRGKRRICIESIDDFWRLDDEWWRPEPVSRLYYAIRLTNGQRVVIYKDLIQDNWYRHSY